MKRFTLLTMFIATLLALPCTLPAEVYKAESPGKQTAEYNAAENSITVRAEAPTHTEYDWDTFTQEPLPYISYILIERHEPGTPWPEKEIGRIESPEPGKMFEFVDRNVEPDKRYEYRLTCYVDTQRGASSFVQAYTGVKPAAPTAMTASTADHTVTTVDISVTAPTLSETGTALTKPMSIFIQLYEDFEYTTIHTIEDVAPGQTCTWQHTNLEKDKSYHYRAGARIGTEGESDKIEADTYVGLDYPGMPEAFTAKSEGESVVLTWEQPKRGGRGGAYDPASTTYTLYRIYPDETEEAVVKDLSGTQYTDAPGFNEECSITYRLTASNAAGSTTRDALTGPVSVGKPAALPFTESFANEKLNHLGWSMQSTQNPDGYTYEAWEFCKTNLMYYLPTDEDLTITPQDADEGFAACKFFGYSEEGQTESLISPRIDVEGMIGLSVKLHYWQVSQEASLNEIKVLASHNDGDWQEVHTIAPEEGVEPQWTEVPLLVVLGEGSKNTRIRIDAIRHQGPIANVFIDNISIEGIKEGAVDLPEAGNETAEKEYFTLSGIRLTERPDVPGIYIVRQGSQAAKEIVR